MKSLSWTELAVSTLLSRPMFIEQVCHSLALHVTNIISNIYMTGINFPSYAFENQAETEGFAKMAKRAGYQVVGLPNYVVWHHDTQEKPGNI